MDLVPLDDNMDLVSSPFRQQDDIDLDLEEMERYSVIPHPDSMFDDAVEHDKALSEHMQNEDEIAVENDEDMFDEDHQAREPSDPSVYPSKHSENEVKQIEDEDILYEDDEEQGEATAADSIQLIADEQQELVPGEEFPQTMQTQISDDDVFEQHQHDGTHFEQGGLKHTHAEENGTSSHDTYHPLSNDSGDQATDNPNVTASNMNDHSATGYTSEKTNIESTTAENRDSNQEQAPEDTAEPHLTHGVTDEATDEITANMSGLYLHSVKVIYQDSELSLFPPTADDASDTFFLPDTTVAYQTLDKLLSACREVLAGSIGEHDELVLDVASLGLHISEDSKYATQITLAQILDVYLTLSHNENVEQTDPLYCSLTSRVCLATQYAYVAAAAQEGRTFSDVSAEHLGSPDDSAIDFEEPSDAETTGPAPLPEGAHTTNVQGLEKLLEDGEHGHIHLEHPTSLDEENVDEDSGDQVRKDAATQGDATAGSPPVLDESSNEPPSQHLGVHEAATLDDQNALEIGIGDAGEEKTADEDETGSLTPSVDRKRADDEIAVSEDSVTNDHPGNDTPASGLPDAALQSSDGQAANATTVHELKLDSDKHDLADLDIEALLEEEEVHERIPESGDSDAEANSEAYAKSDEHALPEYGTLSANDEASGVDEDDLATELVEEDLFEEAGSPATSQSPLQNGASINGKIAVSNVLEPSSKGKRKMPSDEDELSQPELATPDHKRRRPS